MPQPSSKSGAGVWKTQDSDSCWVGGQNNSSMTADADGLSNRPLRRMMPSRPLSVKWDPIPLLPVTTYPSRNSGEESRHKPKRHLPRALTSKRSTGGLSSSSTSSKRRRASYFPRDIGYFDKSDSSMAAKPRMYYSARRGTSIRAGRVFKRQRVQKQLHRRQANNRVQKKKVWKQNDQADLQELLNYDHMPVNYDADDEGYESE